MNTQTFTNIEPWMINTNTTVNINKEDYEKQLAERQRQHLERLNGAQNNNWRPCMHDACPECVGTGIKANGGPCIHYISCPCPKCSPTY